MTHNALGLTARVYLGYPFTVIMSSCVNVGINIFTTAMAGMRRIALLRTGGLCYSILVGVSRCGNLNIGRKIASRACLVCFPSNLGTSGRLILILYNIVSYGGLDYFSAAGAYDILKAL